jgi:hypothetical protein
VLDMFRYTADGLEALEGKGNPTQPRSTFLYELKGIVVHSGSAFTGHYYSYIKERAGSCTAGVCACVRACARAPPLLTLPLA